MSTTQPLAREHQLLLQRLMADHTWSDEQAQTIYNQVLQQSHTATPELSSASLEDAFVTINQQLTKGFGLEIATVVVDKTPYHSIINLRSDSIVATAFEHHYNAHELALIRLVLNEFVERTLAGGGDDEEKEESASLVDMSIPKKDLVNLRGKLGDPYKITTVNHAEFVIESLLEEGWLEIAGQNGNRRRESMQLQLQLAPRTFLELGLHLTNLGIAHEDLPQFLFHRGN